MSKEDYLYGKPTEEIDEPLEDEYLNHSGPKAKKLDMEEKDKVRREKRYFSAFKLIVGCLVFLGLIYLIDVLCSIVLKKNFLQ